MPLLIGDPSCALGRELEDRRPVGLAAEDAVATGVVRIQFRFRDVPSGLVQHLRVANPIDRERSVNAFVLVPRIQIPAVPVMRDPLR